MKILLLIILFNILLCGSICQGYNILGVFHTISHTQFEAGSLLMKELAKRGHNVTTVSPFRLESPRKNINEIVLDGVLSKNKEYLDNYRGVKTTNWIARFLQLYEIGDMMTTGTLQHPKFQHLLKIKPSFDAIIVDATMNDAILGLGEYFNAPIIEFDTTGVLQKGYDFQGYNRFLYSSIIKEPSLSSRCFYDRLGDVYVLVMELLYINFIYLPRQKELRHIYFPITHQPGDYNYYAPSLQLGRNFIDTYENFPNQVGIENLTPKVHKSTIPKMVKEFIETSSNGVIYISLDISTSHLSNETLYNIMGTFDELQRSILWKTKNREFEFSELPENVLITSDVPHNSVLGHPKTKLFITEGNLENVLLATTHGVPVIGITEFVEQSHNLAPLIRAGTALKVDLHEIDDSILSDNIEAILNNSSYSKTAKALAVKVHSVPYRTGEAAASWVEYIIRSRDELHSNSRSKSFIAEYNIDVIAFLVFLIGLSTYIVGVVVKKMLVMAVLFYLNVNVKEKEM